jgi:hypothetical protein
MLTFIFEFQKYRIRRSNVLKDFANKRNVLFLCISSNEIEFKFHGLIVDA